MRAVIDRRAVVRTYMTLAGLYTLAASLIWGVNTLFLLDAGLSIGEVFVVNAAFSAGMVVFEIPTGVVADTLGRRVSYLLSVAVLAVTTLLYLAVAETGGVVAFIVVSVFMGLGFTFYSGALEAWLVDALNTVGGGGELDPVFARAQQVTGVAMLVGTTTGGFLGQLDLAVPFVARAAILGLLYILSLRLMQEIGFEATPLSLRQVPLAMREQARVGVAKGWAQPGLRRLILAGVARASFIGWGFYAAQPYFLELLDRDAIWVVGIITALMSLSTIVGNQIVEVLSRRCRKRSTLLLWSSLTTTVAAVVVGVTDSFWVAVPAFLFITGSLGVIAPVRQAYVHQVTDSGNRATVISFDAMVGSIGGVGGQLALGGVADRRSLSAGYVVGGILTAAALPALLSLRRLGGSADQIIGEAGVESSCAAAGLPDTAQVDTRPAPVDA